MKLATMPAARPRPRSGVAASAGSDDESRKRAIARAVWTDLLWLMPQDRTVTITVRDGSIAVQLGPPDPAPEMPAR